MSDERARIKQLAHAYADAKLARYGLNVTEGSLSDPSAAYRALADAIDAAARLAAAPVPTEPVAWHGLTEGERDQAVSTLVYYGTGFVAPLYAVIEGVERKLMERNAATPPQAAAPVPPMKVIAERNLRAFLTKASFASNVDRVAALECVDVLTDGA